MEGLVSLLLFAALFYFMMRLGCGAHMVHGHGGGRDGHADRGPAGQHVGRHVVGGPHALDPVCGMEVAPDDGYARMHQGREYRFCSRECLDRLEASPEKYAAVEGGAS